MEELMEIRNLGRFSRANVKIAPNKKSKTKASNTLAM